MEKAYEAALAKADAEFRELLKKRSEIDARLGQLKGTIEALTNLGEASQSTKQAPLFVQEKFQQGIELIHADEMGITDSIRAIIRDAKLPMTAPQIRDALVRSGYDVERYASPLTVIHNTIKRMDKQGEVSAVQAPDGEFVGWLFRRKPAFKVGQGGVVIAPPNPSGLPGISVRKPPPKGEK